MDVKYLPIIKKKLYVLRWKMKLEQNLTYQEAYY